MDWVVIRNARKNDAAAPDQPGVPIEGRRPGAGVNP